MMNNISDKEAMNKYRAWKQTQRDDVIFPADVWQAAYESCLSEFEQVGYEYAKMQPTKGTWLSRLSYDKPSQLSIDGGYIINVTPLFTRRLKDE